MDAVAALDNGKTTVYIHGLCVRVIRAKVCFSLFQTTNEFHKKIGRLDESVRVMEVVKPQLEILTGDTLSLCQDCNIAFTSEASLVKHRREAHGSKGRAPTRDELERIYWCELCEERFSSASALGRHSKAHAAQKPHKCEWCSEAFAHKSDLERHIQVHNGLQMHQCTICHK